MWLTTLLIAATTISIFQRLNDFQRLSVISSLAILGTVTAVLVLFIMSFARITRWYMNRQPRAARLTVDPLRTVIRGKPRVPLRADQLAEAVMRDDPSSVQKFGYVRERRLRTSREFRAVFDHRQSVSDGTLILYGLPNGRRQGRLGLSVSKKVGNAVVRNRWKRRIREGFRLQPEASAGWDFVVIPRRGARCEADRIATSLNALARRLRKRQQRQQS